MTQVRQLPLGACVAVSGVAALDLSTRRFITPSGLGWLQPSLKDGFCPAAFVGETLFLSANDGGADAAEKELAHSASMRRSMVRGLSCLTLAYIDVFQRVAWYCR